MRHLVIFLLLAMAACAPTSAEKIMADIEQKVQMPKGASALTRYRRYYYINKKNIVGTYVLSANPGREWRRKDQDILILDGGCTVVNVVFSIEKNRIVYTYCNGVA